MAARPANAAARAKMRAEVHLEELGPFQLTRLLGRGGMGEVWAARHPPTGAEIAVKRVLSGGGPAFAQAFAREVRAVASLDHPAIVRVYDRGQDGAGRPWLAMERAEAGLDQRPPGDWAALRAVLVQILDGLAHAHARGVIHRDLKPSNALWVGGRLVLADFGLAWAPEDGEGRTVGSPGYMAPEQITARWRMFGPWTDVYALGATAWELATGGPVFERPSVRALLRAQVQDPPGPLAPRFAVPDGFEAWVRTCLSKRPSDRYASAAAAARALSGLGEVDGGGPRSAPLRALATMTLSLDDVVEEGDALALAGPSHHLPVPARWRPVRAPAPPPRLGGLGLGLFALRPVPFVGRGELQDQLWDALGDVARSGRARVVALVGPPGVGKSRLAEWLVQRGLELGVVDAVRLRGDLASALRSRLRTRGLATDDIARRARAQGIALAEPLAAWLSGEDEPTPSMQVRLALTALVAWSEPGPLVVWAEEPDAATAQLLDRIAGLRIPVLGVVTARSGGGHHTVAVPPLTAGQTRVLAEALLLLDRGVVDQLVARAEGIPLFAVQLAADWVARGWLVAGEGGFRLAEDAEGVVPQDLQVLWEDELARAVGDLEARRRWVRGLALVPEPVGWELARGLADALDVGALDGVVERLADAGLVRAEGEGLRMAHGLFRDSLRAAADADPALLAEVATVLAPHWQTAGLAGELFVRAGRDTEAVEPLFEGMRVAHRHRTWDRVAALDALLGGAFDRLGLPDDASEREVREDMRLLEAAVRRLPDVHERFAAAEALAEERDWPLLRGRVWHGRAGVALLQGRIEEAIDAGRRAVTLGQACGDDGLTRSAAAALGAALIALGELDQAEEAYALSRVYGGTFDSLLALAEIALGRGDVAAAQALLDEVRPGADLIARVNHALLSAELAWESSDPTPGVAATEQAEALLAAVGHDEVVIPRIMRSLTLSRLGRRDEAARALVGLERQEADYGILQRLAHLASGERQAFAGLTEAVEGLPDVATSAVGHAAAIARQTAVELGWPEESAWLGALSGRVWERLRRPVPGWIRG